MERCSKPDLVLPWNSTEDKLKRLPLSPQNNRFPNTSPVPPNDELLHHEQPELRDPSKQKMNPGPATAQAHRGL